ncbi:MAG TPA: 1,4-alpha-glucan branching protein GlgB [Acidisphaera sp.]|nr:1,4-alpha-glucan branching protein GlgB [Acidisphaera sp.]
MDAPFDVEKADGTLDPAAIEALVQARHGDPFAVLGPHAAGNATVIRTFQPFARDVQVLDAATGQLRGTLRRIHPAGLFAGAVASAAPYRLRIDQSDAVIETEDPYSFSEVLGELDVYLLAEGRHHDVGRALGAHPTEMNGVRGVRFAVWAPNARRVSVVGPFNRWDGRCHPMRLRHGPSVWDLFIPRLGPGELYKYEIVGPHGELVPLKADPVAWAAESPPATASVVADTAPRRWNDDAWMASRPERQSPRAPIAMYEVHAQSWMHDPSLTGCVWDQLIERLIPYVARMGFTHIELMPIMEHPFGGSWGYQPLGQYAPAAALGPPGAFARFVDHCHQANIGVILDWVPAHFPSDAHGLARFDGTPLYEHADPKEGYHHDWHTYIFNLGRNEVRAFLFGSALHWLEHYHADGLRVDAVASMLYRDYSRKEGEWIPNKYGGRENLEAVSFLQDLSRIIAERCPGAVLIAEESTAWPNVTRPADEGGLGFNYKWNMGWMHDTLHYMHEEPVHRSWHHRDITFGMLYAWSEKYVLPLSHDEVVYGKGSLIGKMSGDEWQRFANLRAYYGFMWTYPGKKLMFMGGDIAQWREWNHDTGLDWNLLEYPLHKGVQQVVHDLNHLYANTPALHRRDTHYEGFQWVVVDDNLQSVYAYLRYGEAGDPPALVAFNATPVPRLGYRMGVPREGEWREVMNTDAAMYGGSNMGNGGSVSAEPIPCHGFPASVSLTLPPLATIVLLGPS